MNTNTIDDEPTTMSGELGHIQITLEEVQNHWQDWLARKHNHLGSAAMNAIRQQGDVLIRSDVSYWAEHTMTSLYDLALERVETYWK